MIRRVVVHIDSLRLDGFERAASAAVAAALQRALAGALAEPGLAATLASMDAVERLPVSEARAGRDATPTVVGGAVARAIVTGLRR